MKLLLYSCKAKPYIMKYKDGKYKEIASFYNKQDLATCDLLNGKIVAECDFEVEEITPNNWNAETEHRILKGSCLKEHQLFNYIIKGDENENQNPFYAIHIKNLHIFDKPKELEYFESYKNDNYEVIEKAPQNMMYAYYITKTYADTFYEKPFVRYTYDKYILISIQPQWLCKILNGEKTIEVRRKVLREMIK